MRGTGVKVQVENRAHVRHPCRTSLGGGWDLIDISEGGCQIESPFSVRAGTLCSITLGGVLKGMCQPFNVHILTARQAPDSQRFRLHGRFLLSERGRRELQSWLAELTTMTSR